MPPDAGFVFLNDFPADATLEISAAIVTQDGFVAVGKDFGTAGGSASDIFAGAVWLSRDGYNWEHLRPAVMAHAQLDQLVEFHGQLYATGMVGACFPDADCTPLPENTGRNVWRSRDGRDWELLPQSLTFQWASLTDVVAAGDYLVAVGAYSDPDAAPGAATAGVWRSTDGMDWALVPHGPSGLGLQAAVSSESALAVFGSDLFAPPITVWQSDDSAATWTQGSLEGAMECAVSAGVSAAGSSVAIGGGRHEGVDELVSCAWTSVGGDMATWHGGLLDGFDWTMMRAVTVVPSGFVAVGQTYKPNSSTARGGAAWTSKDGVTWREATRLPELGNGMIKTVVAGPRGIVVFGTQFPDLLNPGESPSLDWVKVWFAPLSALE
ncbi:MAG: hypothetical protein ABI725_04420 [Chloroflexota bacterium]